MNSHKDHLVRAARTAATMGACLTVAMYVYEVGEVELTAHETVRLDHVVYTEADGPVAEQHGDLLAPGTNRLRLEQGVYHFKTVGAAQLRLTSPSSIDVVTQSRDKDPWPELDGAAPLPVAKGISIGASAPAPSLTVLHDLDRR